MHSGKKGKSGSKRPADRKVSSWMTYKPKEIELAGLKAAYMCVDYNLKIPDGRTFPTRSELWIVPRGKMFFMIGIGTRQDEKTGTRKEVHKIIEAIKIDPEADT